METLELDPTENPYDRTEKPKLYQKWYYENITKPKKLAESDPKPVKIKEKPKHYFQNKQPYSYLYKKLNSMNRMALIEAVFIDDNYFGCTGEYNPQTKPYQSLHSAKLRAQEIYKEDLDWYQTRKAVHRVMDSIAIIRKHPEFNNLEAITLLELAFRWAFCENLLMYKHFEPEITVTENELFEIIPKQELLDTIPFYIEDWGNKTAQERAESLIQSTLRALSKLKNNWLESVNEAQISLYEEVKHKNGIYKIRMKNALNHLLQDEPTSPEELEALRMEIEREKRS